MSYNNGNQSPINELGQHLVADVKQVTDTETKQLIAYWVKQPLMISYTRTEGEQDGGLTVTFVQPVPYLCRH